MLDAVDVPDRLSGYPAVQPWQEEEVAAEEVAHCCSGCSPATGAEPGGVQDRQVAWQLPATSAAAVAFATAAAAGAWASGHGQTAVAVEPCGELAVVAVAAG